MTIKLGVFFAIVFLVNIFPTMATLAENPEKANQGESLDIDSQLIEDSPLIQKWIDKIPDVGEDIKNKPIFFSRVIINYSQFPAQNHSSGIYLAVEDVFIGNTPLTLSAEYSQTINNSQNNFFLVGGDAQYYLFPLGNNFNIAPVLGYKYIETGKYNQNGVNLGIKLRLGFSTSGDISLTQSFISPLGGEDVGVTEIKTGYAISENLGLFTGIAWYNSIAQKDSRVNMGLQWRF